MFVHSQLSRLVITTQNRWTLFAVIAVNRTLAPVVICYKALS